VAVAVAVAVGSKHEHSFAQVGRPDIEGRNLDGARSISKQVQISPHARQPSALAACDVLDDDEPREDLADDSGELDPQPGSRSLDDAGTFARGADVLTGEAPANNVN
jgi:hypothetical protein